MCVSVEPQSLQHALHPQSLAMWPNQWHFIHMTGSGLQGSTGNEAIYREIPSGRAVPFNVMKIVLEGMDFVCWVSR